MKIAILYSEKDWTASEIALKIQSLAFSNDLECYISPKHFKRDDNKVASILKKCNYVIFISHDIDTPDIITQNELELVKDKFVLGIIKKSFKHKYIFTQKFIYSDKLDAIGYIKNEIANLNHKSRSGKKHKESDTILLLGLTALLFILLLGLSGSKSK